MSRDTSPPQARAGSYLEDLELVWGTPTRGPPPTAPSPPAVRAPAQTGQPGRGSRTVSNDPQLRGITIGMSVSLGVLLLAAVAVVVGREVRLRRARRKGAAAAASALPPGAGPEGGAGGGGGTSSGDSGLATDALELVVINGGKPEERAKGERRTAGAVCWCARACRLSVGASAA
jgi:hypothetical protein